MDEKQFMTLVAGGLVIFLIVRFFWPESRGKGRTGEGEFSRGEEIPLKGTKLVMAFRATYAAEAHFVKGLLQNAGIPSTIYDEEVTVANPLYSFAVGGIKVMVPVERQEEAKSIVQEYIQTDQETFRERTKTDE